MSDQHLIEIKAKSKTGQVVTFHVAEILEIDGQPMRPGTDTILTNILQRLDALEAASATREQSNG